jgi:hypothetical protein
MLRGKQEDFLSRWWSLDLTGMLAGQDVSTLGGRIPAFVGSAKGIDCRASGSSSRERIGAAAGTKGVGSNPCPPEIWLHGSLAGGGLRRETVSPGGHRGAIPFSCSSEPFQKACKALTRFYSPGYRFCAKLVRIGCNGAVCWLITANTVWPP